MVKFCEKLENYDVVLSFDLAKRLSGYILYDFRNKRILDKGMINSEEIEADYIYDFLYKNFREVIKKVSSLGYKFFITKEKLPNQAGIRSTIATLQELAKVHAVFDLAVLHEKASFYDMDGVHSVSVKAYFRKLMGIEKPSKEDIANYIKSEFYYEDFSNFSYDVTDSLAVSMTLLGIKWNNDIKEEIKNIKKETKKFKSDKKKNELLSKIEFLENLKIKDKGEKDGEEKHGL